MCYTSSEQLIKYEDIIDTNGADDKWFRLTDCSQKYSQLALLLFVYCQALVYYGIDPGSFTIVNKSKPFIVKNLLHNSVIKNVVINSTLNNGIFN